MMNLLRLLKGVYSVVLEMSERPDGAMFSGVVADVVVYAGKFCQMNLEEVSV